VGIIRIVMNYLSEADRRHSVIGPSIASRRMILPSSSHSDPYVYRPCPIASICRNPVKLSSATGPENVMCTSELANVLFTPRNSPLM